MVTCWAPLSVSLYWRDSWSVILLTPASSRLSRVLILMEMQVSCFYDKEDQILIRRLLQCKWRSTNKEITADLDVSSSRAGSLEWKDCGIRATDPLGPSLLLPKAEMKSYYVIHVAMMTYLQYCTYIYITHIVIEQNRSEQIIYF